MHYDFIIDQPYFQWKVSKYLILAIQSHLSAFNSLKLTNYFAI